MHINNIAEEMMKTVRKLPNNTPLRQFVWRINLDTYVALCQQFDTHPNMFSSTPEFLGVPIEVMPNISSEVALVLKVCDV